LLELLVFGSLIGLIVFTRLPLGFVMLFCGTAGISALHPRGLSAGVAVAEQQIIDLALNYNFSVLPLFILMGIFVVKAGMAEELFEAARRWLGHVKGGLGMATIVACGGFSAMTASSSAAAATMAKIAVPEMDKAKYDKGFSAGTVAAGGTMGILIPPSGALIIYALLIEGSVAELFVAGMIPGLLQLLLYMLVMFFVALAFPKWAPAGHSFTWRERFAALWKVWGVLLLFGGGLALSAQFGASGLTEWIGEKAEGVGGIPVVILVLIVAAGVLMLTELTSNTATAATFLPLAGGLALGLGIDPLLLAIPVAFAASWGFMLPSGTGPNAIAWSTGHIELPKMLKSGLLLDLAGVPIIIGCIWMVSIVTS